MPSTNTTTSSKQVQKPYANKNVKFDASTHENRVAFLVGFFTSNAAFIFTAKKLVNTGDETLELPIGHGTLYNFNKKDIYAACERLSKAKPNSQPTCSIPLPTETVGTEFNPFSCVSKEVLEELINGDCADFPDEYKESSSVYHIFRNLLGGFK